MDKGKIAERVLSLAMAPTVASTIVGDWEETGASRNVIRFWSNVAQVLVASCGRDIADRPLFILGLAVRGALVQFAVAECALLSIRGAGAIFAAARLAPGHATWFLFSVVLVFLAPFCAGGWIVRRSPGKFLAVCVAMTFVSPLIQAIANVAVLWVMSVNGHQPLWLYGWEVWFFVPYLLGALFGARGFISRRSPARGASGRGR